MTVATLRPRAVLPCLVLVVSVFLAITATARAGDSGLDLSFGSAGLAVSDFGATAAGATAVALAPDGTIVAVGPICTLPPSTPSRCDLAMVRYSANGSELQRTPSTFSPVADFSPSDVAVDSLGRIVVVGRYYSQGWSPAVVRYLPDGSIDPTLSTTMLPPSFAAKELSAVAVDSADRILLAGPSFPDSADAGRIRVARLLSSGSPDPSFGGGDGVAPLGPEPVDAPQVISELLVAVNGSIFIGGGVEVGDPEAGPSGAPLIRALDGTGNPLPGFSAPTSFENFGKGLRFVTGIALDSKGRLLVSLFGNSKFSMSVARLDSSGALDASFGGGGLASIALCARCDNNAAGVVVDATDRPYVIGYGTRLTRYTADGLPDLSFAPGGTTTIRFGKGYKGTSTDLLVNASGKVVVAGARTADVGVRESLRAPRQFALAQYGYPTCDGRSATIIGTSNADQLRGTPRRDVILAGAGNDSILTFGGNDLVCAGSGGDLVKSGAGNDRDYGQAGNDRLYGGSGNDLLFGGNGNDRLFGGSGKNRIRSGPGD